MKNSPRCDDFEICTLKINQCRTVEIAQKRLTCWCEIQEAYNEMASSGHRWIYRGQSDACQPIKTTLERTVEVLQIDKRKAVRAERGLLREFKRKAHHYDITPPQEHATLEWLALMRHHDVPSRLLDCTYSFFVGLFFAIEMQSLHSDERCPSLWAINSRELRCRMKGTYKGTYKELVKLLNSFGRGTTSSCEDRSLFIEDKRFVYPVNPERLNDRLIVQQGIFLWSGDATVSFMDNLEGILGSDLGNKWIVRKYKLQLKDLSARKEVLYHLHRMNINRATLFPGLDGFARSVAAKLAFPNWKAALDPGDDDC